MKTHSVSANPPTKPCPLCGGTLYKDSGFTEVPVALASNGRKVEMRLHPVVFYGCSTCEHCEEV